MKPKPKVKSISLSLSGGELRLLQRVSYSARRSGGRKLSNTEILRALIRLLGFLEVRFEGVRSVAQLQGRLLKAPLGGRGKGSRRAPVERDAAGPGARRARVRRPK